MRGRTLLLGMALLAGGCAPGHSPSEGEDNLHVGPAPLLYVWAGDLDQRPSDTDFLAVLDSDPESPQYGEIIATAPAGAVGTNPHHAEPVAPTSALLFANGYRSGRTFLFDLAVPGAPVLSAELAPVPGFSFPHSFLRLSDGDLLATMQYGDGSMPGNPGGLAKFDSDANLISVTSAADPEFEGERIRPYSVEAIPELDRLVTTSRTMNISTEQAADLVQIWRLSDSALLNTLRVPRVEPADGPECVLGIGERCRAEQYPAEAQPFESRAMNDGSVIMNTLMCGLYRISEIHTSEPAIELALNYPDLLGCSVPAVMDDFLILPVMFSETILVIDISDPTDIKEASRFNTPGYQPHWAAADPGSSRVVVTSSGPAATHTVLMFEFHAGSGLLTLDDAFGSPEFPRAGVSFYRENWPHGQTGTAIPHAALFGYR
ncbi:MAG: selenium-binding protein SBP56-related protein [Rhodothermales bacterium]